MALRDAPSLLARLLRLMTLSSFSEDLAYLLRGTTLTAAVMAGGGEEIVEQALCIGLNSLKEALDMDCTIYAAGASRQLAYRWTIASATGLNNISSITGSASEAQLTISPGELSPDSEYTFTCQV